MSEAASEQRWEHVRAVTVTTVASVGGILAGIIAAHLITEPDETLGVAVFGAAVVIQFPVLKLVGVKVENFGFKDYLFIVFMTFCFWFVTLGIMLTTEAEFF